MKHFAFVFFLFIFSSRSFAQTLQQLNKQRVKLPNGWSLTPVGRSLPLGDLPLNMVVSRSGKYVGVTNNGQGVQSIQLFDALLQKQLDSVIIPTSWYGLQFSSDDKYLYASGGNNNLILKYAIVNTKLRLTDSIVLGKRWPVKISPAGMAIDDKKNVLYVVTKENKSLYIIDLLRKTIIKRYDLDDQAYTCVLSPAMQELYISCWGCSRILVFNTATGTFKQPVAVGDHPNEIITSRNGRYLYVCNANDNSVSVIDVEKQAVIETLNTALYADAPSGSTPNGLALSEDQHTLYIANADNNCLAVFDVSAPGASTSKGFIPVGWYPTSVKVINKKIWVANGKGYTSMANPYGPNPMGTNQKVWYEMGSVQPGNVQYIAHLFKGTLSIINPPDEKQLGIFSASVYNNTPYTKKKEAIAEGVNNGVVPTGKGTASPVKYVFYIIKENRTYDQILGDMPEGNGDTSLVLFGEKYTPNLHAIARQFVLLDNFFVDAEVSADGHNWTMGAYATDYLEKNWPAQYSSRGGDYPGEGKMHIADNKGGFIWNNCKRNGVSYRSYGEFADNYKANVDELKDHFCPYYVGFNLAVRDTVRFNQWQKDFDSLLANKAVPSLNTIRMGNDHTEGLRKGRPTPFAHVADNDLAVGMVIEHLSKSPIWNETAVFVVEDDAQNGADHVDAHRSTAYLAGGFVKRGFVDHTAYTTTSLLRTIELILGLPPMTQYDAAAVPMWRCFDSVPKPSDYTVKQPNVNLNDKNMAVNKWQRQSEKFNLAKEDAVPDLEFNKVLWHAVKGNLTFPGAKRSAFVQVTKTGDE